MMTSRALSGFGLALLFVFPFVVVVAKLADFRVPLTSEVGWVFLSTTIQASLSAFFSVVFGMVGAFGLLSCARYHKRGERLSTVLALAPNAGPVILLLIAVMKLFPWARGLSGIVFVHVLLNAGLLSVVFAEAMRSKMTGYAELAWIEGVSRLTFFQRVVLPLLRTDIVLGFLFVFALCFASFAVPLALGGARATTIEVLIYEKIRISGNWSEAVGLAFLQTLAVLVMTWFLSRAPGAVTPSTRDLTTPLLGWKYGVLVPLFGFLVLVVGLLDSVLSGAQQVFALSTLRAELPSLVAGSVLVGFLVGLFTIALLLLVAYIRPEGTYRRLLAGYAAPSSVLVGFAVLILWRDLGIATYFKIALALGLVIVPSFLRFRWIALLDTLRGQAVIANILSAGPWLTFKRIVLPQVIQPAFFLGGVAALWAWGDFALSSVVGERSVTLAMAMRGLMDSYRLDAATFLAWFVIVGGLSMLGLFVGVGNVLGQKPKA